MGVNVIAQLVAVDKDEEGFSLSCNPDIALDLMAALGSRDALVYSMLLRHRDNDVYRDVLRVLGVQEKFGAVIRKKGDTRCFDKGLFGATEMFVDSFMHLIDAGIMKRRVYDHARVWNTMTATWYWRTAPK